MSLSTFLHKCVDENGTLPTSQFGKELGDDRFSEPSETPNLTEEQDKDIIIEEKGIGASISSNGPNYIWVCSFFKLVIYSIIVLGHWYEFENLDKEISTGLIASLGSAFLIYLFLFPSKVSTTFVFCAIFESYKLPPRSTLRVAVYNLFFIA